MKKFSCLMLAILLMACGSKGKEFDKHYNLGQLHAASQKWEEAIEEWQKAVEIDPHNKLANEAIKNIQVAQENLKFNILECKENQAKIETAAAIIYANNAIAGSAAYPTSIEEMVKSGNLKEVPTCPSGGTYKYNPDDGTVTCSIPTHKR